MDPKSLFGRALTFQRHEADDLHYIGESLPAPSIPATLISDTNVAGTGGSSVPAREDHTHDINTNNLADSFDTADINTFIDNFGDTNYENFFEGVDQTIINNGGPVGYSSFTDIINHTNSTQIVVQAGNSYGTSVGEIVFSRSGVILDTSESPAWAPDLNITIVKIKAILGTAAAIEFKINDATTTLTTKTMADNTNVQEWTVDLDHNEDEKLTVEISDVDDALGADLCIILYYVAR